MVPRTLLACLVMVTLCAGCGDQVPPGNHRIKRVNWYLAGTASVNTLDPTRAIDPNSIAVCSLLYEGLVGISAHGRIIPGVAESWTIGEDGKSYVFVLRPGLRFSNGQRVTTAGVVSSFRRALSPRSVDPTMPGYISGIQISKGQLSIAALGTRRVQFVLRQPDAQFLAKLSGTLTFARTDIVDTATVHKYRAVWTQHADGLGPYRLKSWIPGKYLVLQPNPYFQGLGRATRNIRITFAPRSATAIGRFQSHPNSIVTGLSASTSIPTDISGYARRITEPNLDFVLFNTSEPPFNSVSNRRALATSLGRAAFVHQLLGNGAKPLAGNVPRALMASGTGDSLPAQPSPINLKGRPVFIFPNTRPETMRAHLLAQVWNAATGVRLTLKPMTFGAYLTALETGSFNMATASWGARDPDAADFLEQLTSTSPLNLARWKNLAFDRLMTKANGLGIDSIARRRDLDRADTLAVDRAPWIPLDSPTVVALIHPDVTDLRLTPFGLRFADSR